MSRLGREEGWRGESHAQTSVSSGCGGIACEGWAILGINSVAASLLGPTRKLVSNNSSLS